MQVPTWLRSPAAWVLGLLITGGVTFALVDDSGPGPNPSHHRTVTVTLGGQGHKKVALPPPAQAIAKTQEKQDAAGQDVAAESDLSKESPNATGPEALKLNVPQTPVGQPQIPAHLPLASAELPGCRSYPVRNHGMRHTPILLGVTHWTAGPDTFPSWNGILGNVRWFDLAASQASSNEILDSGGNCALTVAEALKPWTNTNYNGYSVTVEVTNRGTRPLVRPGAGLNKLAWLYAGWHKRWKLPLQRASVKQSCPDGIPVVYRPGITEHVDLGSCGGGHPDVAHDPQVDQAIKLARKIVYGTPKFTKQEKWARHHAATHRALNVKCSHRRDAASAECRGLRVRNRKLHELLARKR